MLLPQTYILELIKSNNEIGSKFEDIILICKAWKVGKDESIFKTVILRSEIDKLRLSCLVFSIIKVFYLSTTD